MKKRNPFVKIGPIATETEGKITAVFKMKGKLYVTTADRTYRVRIRKRWRDKNKPPLALFREQCTPPVSSSAK